MARRTVMLLCVLLACVAIAAARPSKKAATQAIQCSVCETLMDKVMQELDNTPESYETQERFRLDEKKRIPYSRSEFRIDEVLEQVCESELSGFTASAPFLPDHPFASSSSSSSHPLREILKEGQYDPVERTGVEVSEANARNVLKVCHNMVGRHEATIAKLFRQMIPLSQVKARFCSGVVRACPVIVPSKEEL